jgi:hypothetical protein
MQAALQDQTKLHQLLDKANEYSKQLSKRLAWENIEKAKKAIDYQLQLGNVFIIRGENGTISSSIILNETNDVWDKIGEDDKALYFTKLIKDPDEAQSDEAKRLLTFAAEEAKRRNKLFLRCDAVSDHKGIVSYYKNLGFKERGHFLYKPSRREGILLEISASQFIDKLDSNKVS